MIKLKSNKIMPFPLLVIWILLLCSLIMCSWPPKENRLITLFDQGRDRPGTWVTPLEIFKLIGQHKRFMDITNVPNKTLERLTISGRAEKVYPIPAELRFEKFVTKQFTKIRIERAKKFVKKLSSFKTRESDTEEGLKSAKWIKSVVETFVEIYKRSGRGPAEVRLGPGDLKANTIIVHLEGRDPTLKSEVVVLSAHMDSLNSKCIQYFEEGLEMELNDCQAREPAPGANDNASGCTVLLETLIVLVKSGFVPKRTIEFHFYAAEEYGTIGSEFLAEEFYNKVTNMVGLLNVDCAGWQAEGAHKQIGIQVDKLINIELTDFVFKLAGKYLKYEGVKGNHLPEESYSDYLPWYWFSYPSAHIQEVKLTPFLHTENDTFETINFEQLNEFIKLSIAYLVEYGEPINEGTPDEVSGRSTIETTTRDIGGIRNTWAVYAK